jgi:hypothetical protein
MEEAKRVARMAAIAHDKSKRRENYEEAQNPKERRRRSRSLSLSLSVFFVFFSTASLPVSDLSIFEPSDGHRVMRNLFLILCPNLSCDFLIKFINFPEKIILSFPRPKIWGKFWKILFFPVCKFDFLFSFFLRGENLPIFF